MTLNIRYKLILAFAALSLFVTAIAFAAILYSFRSGFIDYLNQVRFAALTKVHQNLSDKIQTRQQWDLLRISRRHWHFTLLQSLNDQHEDLLPLFQAHHDAGSRDFRARREGRKKRLLPGKRFVLLDENQQVIHGRYTLPAQSWLLPINVENKPVGYIGLEKLKGINSNLEQVFVGQQTRYFIVIAIMACLLSLIVAFVLAKWMATPLQTLATAMNRLMQRDYATKVDYRANDEIGVLSQAFNQLSRSLAEHERSQQQWIADISHELRTPLSTLKGELEALQDGVRPLTAEGIYSLYEEVLRLQKIVDDLHQLSLSDLGAIGYQFDSVELCPILEDLMDHYQSQLKDINCELINNINHRVYADKDRLYQLFVNLLQNSIHYTDKPGNIRITLTEYSSTEIQLCWEDSAPGVPVNQLEKIFERLFRAEKSRNRRQGGSGLGLSICKAIVDAHGGRIDAEPSALGGLTLTVYLPKAAIAP
ncbi:MAG: ATP-binding protein [Pseudomonadota bacterium]